MKTKVENTEYQEETKVVCAIKEVNNDSLQ